MKKCPMGFQQYLGSRPRVSAGSTGRRRGFSHGWREEEPNGLGGAWFSRKMKGLGTLRRKMNGAAGSWSRKAPDFLRGRGRGQDPRRGLLISHAHCTRPGAWGGRIGDSQASLGGDGPFRRAQQAISSSPVCVHSEIGLNIWFPSLVSYNLH